MCLLVLVRDVEGYDLVVAANRDERLDRAATPMDVLRPTGPRVLGGRDEEAGGTWLAVNEHGVVAGLTNRPAKVPGTRDPDKRSRGELPLFLASHPTAAGAADAFAREFRPSDFNPSWLVVADRSGVFTIDMAGDDEAVIERSEESVLIVENSTPGSVTIKTTHVSYLLDRAAGSLASRLEAVMASHEPAPDAEEVDGGRPAFATAPCVHSERYGTRWTGLVLLGPDGPPDLRYTDGPSCTAAWQDATPLWRP